MKKIFTLMLGLTLAVAMFAADRRPTVTINSSKKYEVVIDGRSYAGNSQSLSLANLRAGGHTIKVFEVNKGFSFFKIKRLVASSSFQLRNMDMNITIDRFGRINIMEERFGRNDYGRNDRGRDQKGWDDHSNDRDGHH
jgi:hypothetical protein